MTARIRQVIYEIVTANPERGARDIAGEVLAKCTKNDLLPLVEDEVAEHMRNLVRGAEVAAFKAAYQEVSLSQSGVEYTSTPITRSAFRALFHMRFALGDGREVTWGKATLEEHQQRVEMLRKKRDGIDATISRHLQAILALEESGARCLDEMDGAMGEAAD